MRKPIVSSMIGILALGLLGACSPILSRTVGSVQSAVQPVVAQAAAPAAQVTQPAAPTPGAPTGRTISVSGTGKVTLTPDIAYVNIGVHTEAPDAKTALATNTADVQKVVNAIKGTGVDAKDIQTTNFNIYPANQYGPNGQVTETKYAVDNTVYVTVRKLDSLGSLLDTVVTSGANTVNGIQFDVADKTAATSDARKQAIQDARKQAEELAAAAGVKVGEIQSISIYTNAQPIPYSQSFGKGMGGATMAADVAVPISSGQMILTADVSIVYAIQ